jgi:hypothetical protein
MEGTGGGHAPDIIRIAGERHVLPAWTNPTRPFTVNTAAEHLDMIMVAHHLNPNVETDLKFAESRVRPSTMAAESILQDMGAISVMSSDAQAMGRIGEVVIRTWQTAHVMKELRRSLPGDGRADNHRSNRARACSYVKNSCWAGMASSRGYFGSICEWISIAVHFSIKSWLWASRPLAGWPRSQRRPSCSRVNSCSRPSWQETSLLIPAALEGDAAILPLAGPAVLVTALAPDSLTMRRQLDAGVALLSHSLAQPRCDPGERAVDSLHVHEPSPTFP